MIYANNKAIKKQIFQYPQECCFGAVRYLDDPLDALSHVGTEHGFEILTFPRDNINIGIYRLIFDHEHDIGVFLVVARFLLGLTNSRRAEID
jgi:hypothetical protein